MYAGYYVAPPGDPNHYRAPNYGAAPQYAHYYAAPDDGWTGADQLNPDAPRYYLNLSAHRLSSVRRSPPLLAAVSEQIPRSYCSQPRARVWTQVDIYLRRPGY